MLRIFTVIEVRTPGWYDTILREILDYKLLMLSISHSMNRVISSPVNHSNWSYSLGEMTSYSNSMTTGFFTEVLSCGRITSC